MGENLTLISRAQSGDEQAFAELMRAYYAFVYRIVIEIVNNPHDAEEVAQDTFLNVYRGLARYDERMKFRGWLAKIARNRALNWQRTKRLDTVPFNDVSEGTLQAEGSPSEQLIRDEELAMVRRAMNTLSQKDRDIARSYYLEGASYDELIRAHGLSYKAISFRLSRAKRTLAKRLQYLFSAAYVPPAITLKKISSGGLTAMKIGTAPKITVGVIAIIALAFLGSRQLLSPEEDSSPSVEVAASITDKRDQSGSEIDANRKNVATAPSRADEPQISAEEMEQIEDFFAQLDEPEAQLDTAQPAETEFQEDADERVAGNTDVLTENTEQPAEEVMNAYVEALKNLNFKAMLSLETAAAREETRNLLDGFDNYLSDPVARGMLQSMLSQAEIIGSEYVGDEFHFRLRVPLRMPVLEGLEFPEGLEPPESLQLLAELPESDISLYKMQKEDGTWRIYKQ